MTRACVAIAAWVAADDGGDRQSLWRVRSDCLGEEDGNHADANTASITINAAGQHYRQIASFIYLEDAVTETPNVSVEMNRRIRARWMSFNRYRRELYDRPRHLCST